MSVEAPERPRGFLIEGKVAEQNLQFDPASIFRRHGGREAKFEMGEHLFNMGQNFTSIFYVTSGLVALERYSIDGEKIIQDVIKPGDIVGWDALTDQPSSSTAVALKDSEFIRIPITLLSKMIGKDLRDTRSEERDYPYIHEHVIQLLVEAGRRAEKHDQLIIYGTPEERVIGALLNFMDTDNTVDSNQENIASRAVVTNDTVSDKFAIMKAKGIIKEIEDTKRGKIIYVDDIDHLEKLADVPFTGIIPYHSGAKNRNVGDESGKLEIEKEPTLTIDVENLTEEQKWLRTLSRKGVTFGKALKLIRLNQKKDLANLKGTGRSVTTLSAYELGDKSPTKENLDTILEAYGIDKHGKIAQLLRLTWAKIEPNSLKDLQIEQLEPNRISKEAEMRLEILNAMPTVCEMLIDLIVDKFVYLQEFADAAGIHVGTIYQWNNRTVSDGKILLVTEKLDLDIHDPITLFLLDRAEEERKRKRSKSRT